MGIFCDTADTVATHFAFRAVGIKHPHAHVGLAGSRWGKNEDQSIAADAKVAVGNLRSSLRGVRNGFGETVDVDVVVADAVHLGELHGDSVKSWAGDCSRISGARHADSCS